MSNTNRLINLATRLAGEEDHEAAIRRLAAEARGDRELVRRAHRRLTQDYVHTDDAERAANLLGMLLDPTAGWLTALDDLDQQLLEVVRNAEARMRVLTGGDVKRLQEASIRLRGETPERKAASRMLELAAERAARARQPRWPAQRQPAPPAPEVDRVAANPVILDLEIIDPAKLHEQS